MLEMPRFSAGKIFFLKTIEIEGISQNKKGATVVGCPSRPDLWWLPPHLDNHLTPSVVTHHLVSRCPAQEESNPDARADRSEKKREKPYQYRLFKIRQVHLDDFISLD
jgi:hypothetical protein